MKILMLALLVPILSACSNSALLLVNTLARFDNYTLTESQSYGPHVLNKLDIYQPAVKQEGETAKGTIIFFYGGCWGACTTYTKKYYRFVAQALTAEGYVVVIPDYRRYPDVLFPQIMEDSIAVVSWVNSNISNYGGNAEQIFLMGHSSGGHLAAMLTVNERYLSAEIHQNIRGLIGLAGAYDFILDQTYMQKLFANMEYSESQPSHFIDGNEPPMLLLYGRNDDTVHPRNIVNMTKVVEEKGGVIETHIYNSINHVDILAALSIPYRGHSEVMSDITAFLGRYSANRNKI